MNALGIYIQQPEPGRPGPSLDPNTLHIAIIPTTSRPELFTPHDPPQRFKWVICIPQPNGQASWLLEDMNDRRQMKYQTKEFMYFGPAATLQIGLAHPGWAQFIENSIAWLSTSLGNNRFNFRWHPDDAGLRTGTFEQMIASPSGLAYMLISMVFENTGTIAAVTAELDRLRATRPLDSGAPNPANVGSQFMRASPPPLRALQ